MGGEMGGWMGGCRNGWMGGRRVRAAGEYRFSFLVKLKKKGKITLSSTSPEKEKKITYL
jgi:hypothetical protein